MQGITEIVGKKWWNKMNPYRIRMRPKRLPEFEIL